jgi:hypothetical protein
MNTNSFLLKGWSVTLVSALFALAVKDSNIDYVLITYASTPIYWFLDGYYLSQVRQYRGLYNQTKTKVEDDIDFDMNAKPFKIGRNQWIPSVFSTTLILFYGVLLIVTLIVMFVIN